MHFKLQLNQFSRKFVNEGVSFVETLNQSTKGFLMFGVEYIWTKYWTLGPQNCSERNCKFINQLQFNFKLRLKKI